MSETSTCSLDHTFVISKFCPECGVKIEEPAKFSLDSKIPGLNPGNQLCLGYEESIDKHFIYLDTKDKTFRMALEELFRYCAELSNPGEMIPPRQIRVFKSISYPNNQIHRIFDPETRVLQHYFEKLLDGIGELYIGPRFGSGNEEAYVKTKEEIMEFERGQIAVGIPFEDLYFEYRKINNCRIFDRRRVNKPWNQNFFDEMRKLKSSLDYFYEKRVDVGMNKLEFLLNWLGIDSGELKISSP